jgi:hypothetical protein
MKFHKALMTLIYQKNLGVQTSFIFVENRRNAIFICAIALISAANESILQPKKSAIRHIREFGGPTGQGHRRLRTRMPCLPYDILRYVCIVCI